MPPFSAPAPPAAAGGPWAWARRNLFSSVGNTAVTLVCAALAVGIGAALLDFLVLSAAWRGSKLADCAASEGACWPFVRARFDQFVYGVYPAAERWRIHAAFVLAVVVTGLLAIPAMRRRTTAALVLLLLWPLVAGLLLRG